MFSRFKNIRTCKIIHQLYANINPFQLSQEARESVKTNLPEDLCYGEIDTYSLLILLEKIHPKKNEVFYDLGSGCGKALLATKLRYPYLQAYGIEIIPPLHQLAQSQWQKLNKKDSPFFILGNFLNEDFQNADIIYINATAYQADTWQQILPKLITLKSGTRVITSSKQLPSPDFKLQYQGMEYMSWGLTSTFIYARS